jgi:hypothetical protein
MSCNRNDTAIRTPALVRNVALVGALALGLSACARNDAMMEPVMAPPPPMAEPAPVQAPPVYRVRSGSPGVLQKFPRGSEVTRSTRICLAEGEQITISGSNGQQVSYRGPGCMQRTAPPSGTNQGGFTFGRNSYGVRDDVELVP